jgi:hypothetical protein
MPGTQLTGPNFRLDVFPKVHTLIFLFPLVLYRRRLTIDYQADLP